MSFTRGATGSLLAAVLLTASAAGCESGNDAGDTADVYIAADLELQWFRDYTSRYGTYSGSAAFAADAIELISDAVAQVGADRDRIREVLETSQIDGLSGPIRLTADNHSGLMPQALALLVARNGRWRLAS